MNSLKVGIFGQFYHPDADVYIGQLLDVLDKKHITVYLDENFLKSIDKNNQNQTRLLTYPTFKKLDTSFNLLFSIGGDGTMLHAVSAIKDLKIPLAGINTGRLGFLASIPKENIKKSVTEILNNKYTLSERSLLDISINPEEQILNKLNFALNDISITRKNTTSMIKIEAFLNDEYLTTYWSDGLIISTPTGSTAYSLSCGGPILIPSASSFIITPISAHNLNVRPVVIPDDTEIRLKISGRDDKYLMSLDSRATVLPNHSEIIVKKSPFTVNLIQLHNESFIKTLRKKLLWGEDKRN